MRTYIQSEKLSKDYMRGYNDALNDLQKNIKEKNDSN